MTRLKILGAIAMLSMAVATPVQAQAVIQEPGAYAFYHPNGEPDVSSTMAANAMASLGHGGSMARFRSAAMSHPMHARRMQSAKAY
jgi:hypothetical protein